MKRQYKIFATLTMFSLLLVGCNGGRDESSTSSSEEAKGYTITWKNYDDSVLEVDKDVKKGVTPSYDGATPLKPYDDAHAYIFSGWTPEVVPVISDATYKAKFDEIENKYIIDFDLNGGTSSSYHGPIGVDELKKEYFFFDVTRESYNFRGWTYQDTLVFDEHGNQVSTPTLARNMTFKAKWSSNPKVYITVDPEGAGEVTGAGDYEANTNANLTVTQNTGYEFDGWYENERLLSKDPVYTYILGNKDVYLTAKFNYREYAITYHLDGGKNDPANPAKYTIIDEITLKPATKDSDEDKNYFFTGWYDKNDTKVTKINKGTTGAIDLYAKYSETDRTYKVTVTANDANMGTVQIAGLSDTFKPGASVTVKAGAKTNYMLEGWYEGETKLSEDLNYTFTMPKKDLNLTAKFMKESDYYAPKLASDGKSLTYGVYPQNDRVTDTTIIQALSGSTPVSDNLYKLNGKYYSKITASPISNAKFKDGTAISNGQVYWFKLTRVTWNIVESSQNSGNKTYTLISNEILDNHVFHSALDVARNSSYGTIYSNTWEMSDLRTYLQGSFYNYMFKFNDDNITNTANSSAPSTSKASSGEAEANLYNHTASDTIYLFSHDEVSTKLGAYKDVQSKANASDYARAAGVNFSSNVGYYWTRSNDLAQNRGNYTWTVNFNGELGSSTQVNSTHVGVRPALRIVF